MKSSLLTLLCTIMMVLTFGSGCRDWDKGATIPDVDDDSDGFYPCYNGPLDGSCDCDDEDETINPDADEACDGIDNDCDGMIDERAQTLWVPDFDGDGYGNEADAVSGCEAEDMPDHILLADSLGHDCDDNDANFALEEEWGRDLDEDGFGSEVFTIIGCPSDFPSEYIADRSDCNDTDATIHPGATEVCNGEDDDCDGDIDDDDAGVTGTTDWYLDGDSDGYGAGTATTQCEAPANHVAIDGDCNDSDPDYHPNAPEQCDALDRNCDGSPGEADGDSDGVAGCAGDCDDGEPTVYPGATEICDGLDNDCVDGVPEDETDDDKDGYNECGDNDCNDADPAINPGATEVPVDGVDQDCNGEELCYTDGDSDGYGDPTSILGSDDFTCTTGQFANNGDDCDDTDGAVSPAATEVCDDFDVDEDCNGTADDADAGVTGTTDWYLDGDSDGYGAGTATTQCEAPADHVAIDGDCNDTLSDINPGATEIAVDGVDQDCDGEEICYVDDDEDTYGDSETTMNSDLTCSTTGLSTNDDDCDDTDGAVNPAATEVCDDFDVDEDCNGTADDADAGVTGTTDWYPDNDSDGYGAGTAVNACDAPADHVDDNTDCDDNNPQAFPGNGEVIADDVDQDCDGVDSCYEDLDGDGHGTATVIDDNDLDCGNSSNNEADIDDDCDDTEVTVWTSELRYLDDDGDGYGDPNEEILACESDPLGSYVTDSTDCDDAHATANPAGTEIDTVLIDEDCDGCPFVGGCAWTMPDGKTATYTGGGNAISSASATMDDGTGTGTYGDWYANDTIGGGLVDADLGPSLITWATGGGLDDGFGGQFFGLRLLGDGSATATDICDTSADIVIDGGASGDHVVVLTARNTGGVTNDFVVEVDGVEIGGDSIMSNDEGFFAVGYFNAVGGETGSLCSATKSGGMNVAQIGVLPVVITP